MKDIVRIQSILNGLNGKSGIIGTALVNSSGAYVCSSLPSEFDSEMVSVQIKTLFSSQAVEAMRANGKVIQMSIEIKDGVIHYQELNDHFVVVLTSKVHNLDFVDIRQLLTSDD